MYAPVLSRLKNIDFSPPPVKHVFPRKRLMSYLTANKERKLFTFYGKGGDGKTVLAVQFLSEISAHSIWFRLTEEDRDPRFLILHLAWGLLRTCEGKSPKEIKTLLEDDGNPDPEDLFLELLKKNEGREIYFVLDDFHHIADSEESVERVNIFLQSLPPPGHLMILSRCPLPSHFYRLRIAKELLELQREDFIFTKTEALQIFQNSYGLKIDTANFNRIYHVTKGWIGGMIYLMEHLAKLDKDEQSREIEIFVSEKRLRTLDTFFSEEVIPCIPEKDLEVLIRCSLFHEITRDIMEICRSGESNGYFERTEQNCTFAAYQPGDSGALILHPLFHSYLRSRFELKPAEEKRTWFGLAGDYYHNLGDFDTAIENYIAAEKVEQVKRIFNEIAGPLLEQHKYEKIESLLSYFSQTERRSDPDLAYFEGIILNILNPFSSRRQLLSLLPLLEEQGNFHRQATIYTELLQNYFFYQEGESDVVDLVEQVDLFIREKGEKLPPKPLEILNALLNMGRWWISPPSPHV